MGNDGTFECKFDWWWVTMDGKWTPGGQLTIHCWIDLEAGDLDMYGLRFCWVLGVSHFGIVRI